MQDNTFAGVSLSNNILIDALVSGTKWGQSTITYALPTSFAQYGPTYPATYGNGFQAFDAAFQANIVQILTEISKVTGLVFVQGDPATATMRFGRYNDPNNLAYGFFPSNADTGGDVWWANNANSPGVWGDAQMHVFLHEIGHALGLKHPHEGQNVLPAGYDLNSYSAMSYKNYLGEPIQGTYNKIFTHWEQSVPILDIQALQYMYGANFTTNSGDSVYTFSPTTGEMFINGVSQGAVAGNRIFRSIWDGGGNDTYDFSNYSANQTIDLEPGAWSTFSPGQRSATSFFYQNNVQGFNYEPGNIANALLYNGDARSLIENAKGGAGNDTIRGNAAANALWGGLGADSIRGNGGNDAIDGGANVDTAIVGGNRAAYTVTQTSTGVFQVTGPDGTDTLTGIEYLSFDDQIMRLLPGTGTSVNFAADAPATYMAAIRDFDGNDVGSNASWKLIGAADVNGDGDVDRILVNRDNGRFAEVGTAPDGKVYFSDYSWAGETRVVGIYIDPLVQSGQVVAGSDHDSQRRFQNDLQIDNIKAVLGAGDYDRNGLQEVYFALTDGTAFLHAYMHADGNIQYANYQSQAQVTAFLQANGWSASTYAGWFG